MNEQSIPLASSSLTATEVMSAIVYAENFNASLDFYTRMLGLKIYGVASANGCFLYVGENPNGLYLEGGYSAHGGDERSSRLSFMLTVPSAVDLHEKLKSESVRLVHDTPVKMGENAYWFQLYDPSGNILEVVGGA